MLELEYINDLESLAMRIEGSTPSTWTKYTYVINRKENNMDADNVLRILDTRREAARENGNTTELSLLYELTKIVEEYKLLKDNNTQR